MHQIYYQFLCTVISLSLLLPSISYAEVYEWKDKSGKVHFSDTPPLNLKSDKKEIKTGRISAITSSFHTKTASKRAPVFVNKSEMKRMRLDTVVLNLDDANVREIPIGGDYVGGGCVKRVSTLLVADEEKNLSISRYKHHFSEVAERNGYPKNGYTSADGLVKPTIAELSFIAEIKEIQINSCVSSRSMVKKKQQRVASYMKIKWTVIDNEKKKVISELFTEGSDSALYSTGAKGKIFSQLNSFKVAVRNLLSDSTLVKLFYLDADTSSINIAKSNLEYFINLPLSIEVKRNFRRKHFTKQVNLLKQGSVTILSKGGHGSGFIISEKGYVITNWHVVQKFKNVTVVIGREKVRANVIRVDIKHDVALLKIKEFNGRGLNVSKATVFEGEKIYVMGTPLNEKLSHTVTSGIISAKRTFENGNKYYQTDAAINQGNSGGPAFNEYGEVIGIAVSSLVNRAGSSLNINFLIPIEEVMSALNLRIVEN